MLLGVYKFCFGLVFRVFCVFIERGRDEDIGKGG